MNYKQLGRSKALDFFSWAGFQMGFRFDDCVVEYMADFLGRRKLFDDMKCLLLTVSSHKGRVSCRAVSICIRFLGRQGRIREALCTFEEMESKFGCKPDNLVYNNVLYVLCKKESSGHLIDFALAVFRRIESPDTYSYGNILVGLCKFGRFETAIEVFGDMCKSGVVPTRSAVNALIGELCSFSAKGGAVGKVRVRNSCRNFTILVPKVGGNSDAIQPAVGIFWAVYKVGLLPSTFAIIRLLSGLCQLGKVEEAVEILKAVEGKKLSCVGEGYCIVMKALCSHGHVEITSHMFGRMLSQGMKPKLAVYNSIICMLCKLGNLDDAGSVFKMMNKNRCLPDSMTYSALIHAYGEAKNWEASYGLLIEMLGLGYSPHFHTYRLVDKILRENGQMDMCLKLERKLETQILQKLCKDGQLEAAHEKLKSMIGKGFHPPAYVWKRGDEKFFLKDWNHFVKIISWKYELSWFLSVMATEKAVAGKRRTGNEATIPNRKKPYRHFFIPSYRVMFLFGLIVLDVVFSYGHVIQAADVKQTLDGLILFESKYIYTCFEGIVPKNHYRMVSTQLVSELLWS
ncbi:hypothetical protein ACFX2H_013329 [Malus domestica]